MFRLSASRGILMKRSRSTALPLRQRCFSDGNILCGVVRSEASQQQRGAMLGIRAERRKLAAAIRWCGRAFAFYKGGAALFMVYLHSTNLRKLRDCVLRSLAGICRRRAIWGCRQPCARLPRSLRYRMWVPPFPLPPDVPRFCSLCTGGISGRIGAQCARTFAAICHGRLHDGLKT